MDEMIDLLKPLRHRPARPPVSVSSPTPTTSLPSTVRPHFRRVRSCLPPILCHPPPPLLSLDKRRDFDAEYISQWLPA